MLYTENVDELFEKYPILKEKAQELTARITDKEELKRKLTELISTGSRYNGGKDQTYNSNNI